MVIFYLPAWGVSVTARPGWGESWAREVGGLAGNLLCPGSQGCSPPHPQAPGPRGQVPCLGLLLILLDAWSGFIICSLPPQWPLIPSSTKWWSLFLIMPRSSPYPAAVKTQNKTHGYHRQPFLTLQGLLACHPAPRECSSEWHLPRLPFIRWNHRKLSAVGRF